MPYATDEDGDYFHGASLPLGATRKSLVLGIQHYSASYLQSLKASGERLQIQVLGLASIAPDVTPELALAVIESLRYWAHCTQAQR